MNRVDVTLTPDPEGGYSATISDRPGCISEGETVPDTLRNLSEAVDLYDIASREDLLRLARDLGITDEEAGDSEWAQYLTDQALADAIIAMRPESRVIAGEGEDADAGTLDSFRDGMAIVRWGSGVVTPCPVRNIRVD